jgi:hypothetical protein
LFQVSVSVAILVVFVLLIWWRTSQLLTMFGIA